MGIRYHLGLAALVGLLLAAAVGLRLPPELAFVFGAVLVCAIPQIVYLLSRNIELVIWGDGPKGFRVHWDEFKSGSAANCGLPGNEACVMHNPASIPKSVGARPDGLWPSVVRYFGGVKLGAGGLVRAYSESVSAALDRAPLAQRLRLRICAVSVPHTAAGRLENELRAAGYVMAETSYEAQTTVLRLALPDDPAGLARAGERVAALSAGTAGLLPGETEWIDVPIS